jgi:hypothetical protein
MAMAEQSKCTGHTVLATLSPRGDILQNIISVFIHHPINLNSCQQLHTVLCLYEVSNYCYYFPFVSSHQMHPFLKFPFFLSIPRILYCCHLTVMCTISILLADFFWFLFCQVKVISKVTKHTTGTVHSLVNEFKFLIDLNCMLIRIKVVAYY